MKDRHGEHVFCELPDSTICSIPAWMLSPDCTGFSLGPPLICAVALQELHDVIRAWQASFDCDKASLEESPREVMRDSTCEIAQLTAEPAARRCPQDGRTGRQTKGTGACARETLDQCGPGKQSAVGERRRG